MIGYLAGEIVANDSQGLTINVGGVGYEVSVGPALATFRSEIGRAHV